MKRPTDWRDITSWIIAVAVLLLIGTCLVVMPK